MMHRLLVETASEVLLRVTVRPGAKRRGVIGLHGESLKLSVQAPPEKGRANREVIDLLVEVLELDPGQARLVHGETSRDKTIGIRGRTLVALRQNIERLLSELG